jgi:hypothetical protein
MFEEAFFISSAVCVAAFIASAMFLFTDVLGNWIFGVSFIVTIIIATAKIIVDGDIVTKLRAWW